MGNCSISNDIEYVASIINALIAIGAKKHTIYTRAMYLCEKMSVNSFRAFSESDAGIMD